jgi:hypothetical protein
MTGTVLNGSEVISMYSCPCRVVLRSIDNRAVNPRLSNSVDTDLVISSWIVDDAIGDVVFVFSIVTAYHLHPSLSRIILS